MRRHRAGKLFCFGLIASAPALAGTGGGWVEFADETAARLVADPGLGINDPEEKDYAWGDVDRDGDIDIVCVRKEPFTTPGGRRNVLFMNEGVAEGHAINGVFVDRTTDFVVDADDGGQGFLDTTNDRDVILVDVNGDNWLDIVTVVTLSDGLPKTMSHPRVYINLTDEGGQWQGFRYEERRIPQLNTIPGGLPVAPRFCSVAGGDVTGDGRPELYFGDYDSSGVGSGTPEDPNEDVNDRLLINTGDGFFFDSLESRMSAEMLLSAFSMAADIRDMNGDGVLDVVKDTALNEPRRVSIAYNDPDNEGFFDELDIVYTNSPYHITVGDLNNDTRLDIVITDDGQDVYLLNTGNGADGLANFISRPFIRAAGGDGEFGGNQVIADLNQDGFKDVIIADVDVDSPGCNRRMHLYRNLGDLPEVTLQEQAGAEPWAPNGVHDLAVFDINGDTWPDLFIGTCTGTEIWINRPPNDLVFGYPDGLPGVLTPGQPESFRVSVTGTGSTPQPGTGKQYVSINGAPFVETDMTEESPNTYFVNLPAIGCASELRFYVSVETTIGLVVSDPGGAPLSAYSAIASFGTEVILDDRFESPLPGWTVTNDPSLTTGAWERVDPVGTFFPIGSDEPAQPEDDFGAASEETMCYITDQHTGGSVGTSDVDHGPTILTSPVLDLQGTDAIISYARWHFSNAGGTSIQDSLDTEITNDGLSWVPVHSTFDTGREWEAVSFKVSTYVAPTALVQVRFSVVDEPNNSITESGIDNFVVTRLICDESCVIDPDCDDGLFCTGVEACGTNGFCQGGQDPCPGQMCDETTDACADCLTDPDCDNGVFCDGAEACVGGVCTNGPAPCTGSGEFCDEDDDVCVGCLIDDDCLDAWFCNGAEFCDSNGICQPGGDPCPGQLCDEAGDACVECLDDTDCADALFCNGEEGCDTNGVCQPGGDPCPGLVCDEDSDACFECTDHGDCDDGLYCNGEESCSAGTCVSGAYPCGDLTCEEATDACVRLLQPRMGQPLHGLTADQLTRFQVGRVKFDQVLSQPEGLGPIFNQNSCGACHNVGALGGSGSTLVTRFGFADKESFDPLEELGGSLLQANAVTAGCEEVIPPEANVVANRLTPPTFGFGLVEAIPDASLLANEIAPPPGVSGRAHMVHALEDPPAAPDRVGRFGWKAQVATVLSFSADASKNEMGLTNRLDPVENDPNGINPPDLATCDSVADPEDGPDGEGFHFIDRVTDFQRFLAPAPQTPHSGMRGEAVFNEIGCDDCHVRLRITAPAAEAPLSVKALKPYSDFLLHDMGQLGDGIEQGDAGVSEMRTPLLWGLRVREQMMHDGRIVGGTFDERVTAAIGEHGASGSEAAASAAAFDALPAGDKAALIAFLDSLGRAEFDHDGDNDVDLDDYDAFNGCLTGPSPGSYTPDDECSISDFDQNGAVDLKDHAAMQQAFTE